MKTLLPGDRVTYRSATGRRMKAVVADYLPIRARGEEVYVAIIKQRARCAVMIERSKLRKLPVKRVGYCPRCDCWEVLNGYCEKCGEKKSVDGVKAE